MIDNTLLRVKKWLQPPNFTEEFERACELREAGTADWLFKEPEFSVWVNSGSNKQDVGNPVPSLLWVQGKLNKSEQFQQCLKINTSQANPDVEKPFLRLLQSRNYPACLIKAELVTSLIISFRLESRLTTLELRLIVRY